MLTWETYESYLDQLRIHGVGPQPTTFRRSRQLGLVAQIEALMQHLGELNREDRKLFEWSRNGRMMEGDRIVSTFYAFRSMTISLSCEIEVDGPLSQAKQAVLEYLGLGTTCGNIVKANKTWWYQATRMRSIAFQRVADVYQYKIESVREVLSAFLGSFAREIQSQMTASWP